jgi:hypothetical protein
MKFIIESYTSQSRDLSLGMYDIIIVDIGHAIHGCRRGR